MTSTNDTNPRTALEAAHQLNASDPIVVAFEYGRGMEEEWYIGDLVGILQGPLRPGEPRKARVQIDSEYRADFPVRDLIWNLVPNGDGTYSVTR